MSENRPYHENRPYLYGNVERPDVVMTRLHRAVEHLRLCEAANTPAADDQLVLDALHSYDAFVRSYPRVRRRSRSEYVAYMDGQRSAPSTGTPS